MSKKMKNPPVYFVIAQIRHHPVLKLEAYAPDIQDKMRKSGYPGYEPGISIAMQLPGFVEKGNVQQLAFSNMQQVSRFMFSDAEGSNVFIVDQNAITFYSTEYGTFDQFADEFIKGIQIVDESVNLSGCTRIGMRYLDAILPPEGQDDLGEYLVKEVLGIKNKLPQDTNFMRAFSETIFQVEDCSVTARAVTQSGPLGFPPDLLQIKVNLPERFRVINGVHAILDTDAWKEGDRKFDLGTLKSELHDIQQAANLAFKVTVTPAAIAAWNN